MEQFVIVLGVIGITFLALAGLLVAFRKWLAEREQLVQELFSPAAAPVPAARADAVPAHGSAPRKLAA